MFLLHVACRLFPLCMLVICWSGEQVMRVMTNWWLSQWTGQETIRQINQTLGAFTGLQIKKPHAFTALSTVQLIHRAAERHAQDPQRRWAR